ncbi:MAG: hypothetical protein FOGNACKC_03197 [Anaerolineae bacterium]|nr:hypothetical protein [Anaerolineae bacterium]
MSNYTVYVTPQAWQEIKTLPGNIRQRIRRVIDALADDPQPASSKKLNLPDIEFEVHRLRLERWRLIYAVNDNELTVDILAVRKRPPYDYGDLEALLETL